MQTRDLTRTLVLAVTASLLWSASASAAAIDFFVFKASVTLPATAVIERPMEPTDLFIKTKLKSKDLVNLTLGRPLGTKVDKKTEILAIAITFSENAEFSKLIVFDPSQNGAAQVKATIATISSIAFDKGFKKSSIGGSGVGTVEIQETVLGTPSENALHATTLHGGGDGSGPFGFGTIEKAKGKGIVTGELSFTSTKNAVTSTFEGFVTQGKLKGGGKRIGVFTE
jgi:hypothetical protein